VPSEDDDYIRHELRAVELLGPAIKTRAVIEQAKVLLMSRTGWDDARAFSALVIRSQHEHRKLLDVAAEMRNEVLATGSLPEWIEDSASARTALEDDRRLGQP
jgi:ANTAR domain